MRGSVEVVARHLCPDGTEFDWDVILSWSYRVGGEVDVAPLPRYCINCGGELEAAELERMSEDVAAELADVLPLRDQ